MPPSLGYSLFTQIKNLDGSSQAEFLKSLIATSSPTFETNYLEFKGCLESGALLSNEKIREHYGKTASAFANTGGGVLVWGIAADRDRDGVDSARHLALAPNAGELYSRLDVAESTIANPPILGIEKLLVPANAKAGFVVCFIPESRNTPHASTSDDRYYMRVSGHSVRADHTSLRRLFFPEYHSRLDVYFRTKKEMNSLHRTHFLRTNVYLHNRGVGTAEEVSIMFIQPKFGLYQPDAPWRRIPTAWGAEYFRNENSMHPDEMLNPYNFEFPITVTPDSWEMPNPEPKFKMRLYARNEPPIEVEYFLKREHVDGTDQPPTTIREIGS